MNLKTKTVSASLKQNLCGSLSTKQINATLAGRVETRDHSNLNNLEYLKSGHTGFAGIEFGTTAEWNEKRDYSPVEGMLVVYTDYQSYADENGETIYVPGFKIGDGNTYLIDKPFVGEADSILLRKHIEDIELHIQSGEREFWNGKLNYEEPEGDLLIFTIN